jgi:hypothetical protein
MVIERGGLLISGGLYFCAPPSSQHVLTAKGYNPALHYEPGIQEPTEREAEAAIPTPRVSEPLGRGGHPPLLQGNLPS